MKSAEETMEACKLHATHTQFHSKAVHVDITDAASVQKMVDEAIKSFGRIDYCVHSAGVSGQSTYYPQLGKLRFHR